MDPPDVGLVVAAALGSSVIAAMVTSWLGHRNELARRREERRQERLGKTYLAVVEFVIASTDWVEATHPLISRADLGPTEMPAFKNARMLRARLSAYGSLEMQKSLKDFASAVMAFVDAVGDYDSLKSKGTEAAAGEWPKARRAMYDIRRKQVLPLSSALLELANAELAERRLGRWARLRVRIGGTARRPARWAQARMGRMIHRAGKPQISEPR
jgi:hypothetical protein